MHGLIRFRRDEQGVQLLELAIVLPIMLLMFAGIAEFGRYFYEYTTLAKGARLGARYLASKSVSSGTDWEGPAKNLVVYGNVGGTGNPILPGLSPGNIDIQYAGGPVSLPDTVTVRIINYQHESLFDLGGFLNSGSLSLNVDVKPSVTMRFLLTQPTV
jgi:hypothetical protein